MCIKMQPQRLVCSTMHALGSGEPAACLTVGSAGAARGSYTLCKGQGPALAA